ncbi:hypothetical protein, partial [Vibrio lentus]
DYINDFFCRYSIVLYILIFIGFFEAYKSFSLIMAGVPRELLLTEYGRGGLFYMVMSGIFKILCPATIFFSCGKKNIAIAFVGVVLSITIVASRSELSFSIYFLLVLFIHGMTKQDIIKTSKFICLFVFMAIVSTIFLQNRPMSDSLDAVYDIASVFFTYKAYSFHLAKFAIEASSHFENVFFSFFGFPFDSVLRKTFGKSIPIDSDFISNVRYLGVNPSTSRPYLANIMYPWWSWFYGSLGFLGLIIKALYTYVILVTSDRLRMPLTTSYVMFYILFGTTVSHPIMTITHFSSFILVVLLDFAMKNKIKLR